MNGVLDDLNKKNVKKNRFDSVCEVLVIACGMYYDKSLCDICGITSLPINLYDKSVKQKRHKKFLT